jgi:hypothetical protein
VIGLYAFVLDVEDVLVEVVEDAVMDTSVPPKLPLLNPVLLDEWLMSFLM